MHKRALALGVALLALAVWAMPASAAVFKAGDSILLPKDFTTMQDVYAASQDLNAQGTFNGDLISAGLNERITGNVKGSVMVAGMYVDILGNVGHSVRAAGNRVVIGGTINGDVFAAGAFVQILPDAVIKGDLIVGAGNLSIDGKVMGNVKAGGGNIIVNGTINGENKFNVQQKLTIGENAHFAKQLNYTSAREAVCDPKATLAQGSQFIKLEMPAPGYDRQGLKTHRAVPLGVYLLALLIKLVIMLTTALIALHFFRKHITAIGKDVLDKFAANLGWGLVWAIVTPIACIILLATILGSVFGIAGLILYALTWLVASVLAGIILGMWLRKLVMKTRDWEVDWKTALLGVIIFFVVAAIPIIGWIACWIFVLAALGGLVGALKSVAK